MTSEPFLESSLSPSYESISIASGSCYYFCVDGLNTYYVVPVLVYFLPNASLNIFGLFTLKMELALNPAGRDYFDLGVNYYY